MKSLSVELLKAQKAIRELREKAFSLRTKSLDDLDFWYARLLEELIVKVSWEGVDKRHKVRLFEEITERAKLYFGLIPDIAQTESKLVAFGG